MSAIDGIYPNYSWAEVDQGYFVDLRGKCTPTYDSWHNSCIMHTLEFRRNHGKSFEAADHLCTVKVSQPLLIKCTLYFIVVSPPRGGLQVSRTDREISRQ